jgi:hypothetical protein
VLSQLQDLKGAAQEEFGEPTACFVVRDSNGQALSYVYCKDQHGRRSVGTVFTRDEARHLAAAVAKLPELLA